MRRKAKVKKPRGTLAKRIHAAKSDGERLMLSRHDKPVEMLVYLASLLEESREWELSAKTDAQRAVQREAIRGTEEILSRHFLEAVRKRDPQPLRELAKYFEKKPPGIEDPVREKLVILAMRIRERPTTPDGEEFFKERNAPDHERMAGVCETVREIPAETIARCVGYSGGLRNFRRMLKQTNFPVIFESLSPPARGTRKERNSR